MIQHLVYNKRCAVLAIITEAFFKIQIGVKLCKVFNELITFQAGE